jgi:broad specificity phosphatase PhoE
MRRIVELRRHTDNDGDVLTEDGVRAALEIGRSLGSAYEVIVSTGAQRATQTAACFLAVGHGEVGRGVLVNTGLRSDNEDRWKEAYQEAGSGELAAFRSVAPDFVEEECVRLGEALGDVFDLLAVGQTALVVGHSPTNEAAIYGLTGEEVAPLGKGEGVRVTDDDGEYTVERLD